MDRASHAIIVRRRAVILCKASRGAFAQCEEDLIRELAIPYLIRRGGRNVGHSELCAIWHNIGMSWSADISKILSHRSRGDVQTHSG